MGDVGNSCHQMVPSRFPRNWNKIANLVKTKDQHECIEQFVRMPIEDGYLRKESFNQEKKVASPSKPIDNIDERLITAATKSAEKAYSDLNADANETSQDNGGRMSDVFLT